MFYELTNKRSMNESIIKSKKNDDVTEKVQLQRLILSAQIYILFINEAFLCW